MRLEGKSVRDIATELGITVDGAYKCIATAMRAMATKESSTAVELRAINNARLEALLAAIWGRAVSGDDAAIDRARAIIADLRKMWGLDAPTQVQADINHSTDASVIGAEERLATLSDEELLQLRAITSKVMTKPIDTEYEEINDGDSADDS